MLKIYLGFTELFDKSTNNSVSSVDDRGVGYTFYCDTSRERLGCVLMQSGKVVAYGSR